MSIECSVMSDSLWLHGLQHSRFPCFSVSPSLLRLMSIESVNPSNRLIFCHPLLLLPSVFPSIRVFSSEFSHQVAKVLEHQLQQQSFQWIFRVDFYSSCRYAPFLSAAASVKRQTSCMPGPALKATRSKVHVPNSWVLSSLCIASYSRCSL